MKRETLELILSDRQIKASNSVYEIPEEEIVTLLIGREQTSSISGITKITLSKAYLKAETKKKVQTYIEYESIRALSFVSKEVANRSAGFV